MKTLLQNIELAAEIELEKKTASRQGIEIKFGFTSDPMEYGKPGKQPGDLFADLNQKSPLLLVSLGDKDQFSSEKMRIAGSAAVKWMIQMHTKEAWIDLDAFIGNINIADLCEGFLLGAYKFTKYKKQNQKENKPLVHLLSSGNLDDAADTLKRTQIICKAVYLARDWAHEPANIINPQSLSEQMQKITKNSSIRTTVLDSSKLSEMDANAIVSVGKGSKTPSRMIILEYPGVNSTEKPVVLVGKALTFDSGGYSIKPVDGIVNMKYDKCGGINVLAVLLAAAELELETPLVGIIGAAENMISDEAYRPDDIITTLSGKTVEIITTDAEGRMVLCDCLTYAQNHFQPREIIDLATLTGGIVTALGYVRAGLFSNNDLLAGNLFAAGEKVHEPLWRMPLDEEYFQYIKGDDADLKNSGGRFGHPIFGGLFLKQFIENDLPWAHLDIAGTADTNKELPYCQKGATGFGVRLLLDYLSAR